MTITHDLFLKIKDRKTIVGAADGSIVEGCECFTYVPMHSDDALLNAYDKHQIVNDSPHFVFTCEWENGNATLLQQFNHRWVGQKLIAGEHYVLNAYDEHALVPDVIAISFIESLQSGRESDTFKQWNDKYEKLTSYNREEPIVAVLKYIIG